jgi:predicted  nucleic acid-binding Zn-ribbon protein
MANANIKIDYTVIYDQLTKSREELARLEKQTIKNEKESGKLRSELNNLNNQAKNTTGSFGNMKSSLMSLGAAFGITSGVLLFANALKNAGKTVVDFQKNQSILAGVLGTNRKGVERLTQEAQRLGSTTVKSASQVSELQIELARLGFAEQAIIDLTPALINGSIALNAELDRTAVLVGAMVNTFDDFSTTDAPEIVDKMTLATQRSALSFGKLETMLPIVAGAANAAGIDFSQLLALLGKLSDAGIDASMSATALRNIFIESAAQGKNYTEILETIANSTDKLTASNDEFGVRGAVSASIISKNIGAVQDLTTQIDNAGGTAQRVADENMTTLANRIISLESAYEGFILSIENGEGPLGKATKMIVDGLAASFQFLTPEIRQMARLTAEETEELERLSKAAANVDKSYAQIRYGDLIEKNKELKNEIQSTTEAIDDIALQMGIASEREIAGFKFETETLTSKLTELELELQRNEIAAKGFSQALKEDQEVMVTQPPLIQSIIDKIKALGEERLKATSPEQLAGYNLQIALYKEELKLLDELGVKHEEFQAIKSKGLKEDVSKQSAGITSVCRYLPI